VNVVMAMSTARRTFDFEKEFARTRDAVGQALGVKPLTPDASDARGTAPAVPSENAADSTR